METINESKIIQTPTTKHFNHDKAWFYHLNQIEFDLLLTLHFKDEKHYKNTIQADCNRRKLLRNTFGNIAMYLEIPHRSLFYFGITELDCQNRMHAHILLKTRKDLKISSEELVEGIKKTIDNRFYRKTEKEIPRSVEVIRDSTDTTNYILKIKTNTEYEHRIKECFYHSKNIVQICDYMKQGLW
jgi:hypothetical protein